MKQGTIISAAGHSVLILLAMFGLPERARDFDAMPAQVTDVSIVSLEAFEAARSSAPDEAAEPEAALTAPVADTRPKERPTPDAKPIVPEAEVPDAPAAEASPDVSGLTVAQPAVRTDVAVPEAEADTGAVGLQTPLIDAAPQDGSVNSTQTALLVPQTPNAAPRIDTKAAPKPPEPVKEAPEAVAETAKEPSEAKPVEEPTEAAAPKEAATETIPDAKPEERPTTPLAAARPRGRPDNLAADAEKRRKAEEAAVAAALAAAAKDAETAAEKPAEQPAEQAAAAPAAETPAEAPRGSRLGGDFNASQRQAVGDAIGGMWNKQLIEGKQGYEQLIVIVRVRLSAAGKVMGDVEPVEPSSPQGDFKVAYDAARRAILRAQPIPLPQDIFRDGDYLEIRFDPGRSAISLN